jgi:NAD(P)-dependent dehydrogenase (short-subunit alcohol dehydrogenase family)
MSRSVDDNSAAVLVTGASTGIGRAVAIEMDRRAWRVFAGVRREQDGRRLRDESSGQLVPVTLDVTDRQSIHAAADAIGGRLGARGLAGLVNNAGIVVPGPIELVPLEDFRRQLEVNVVGQMAVTQAMLPLLRKARGRIVNVSSASGLISTPYVGPYAASKFALEAISDALRVELRAWGIHVALVEPGSVKTPIWEKAQAEADRLGSLGAPEAYRSYEADLEAMRKAIRQAADTAMPVERVVAAVAHALTARRPRTRYLLGLSTRLAVFAFKRLPDRARDWILRRSLGLP